MWTVGIESKAQVLSESSDCVEAMQIVAFFYPKYFGIFKITEHSLKSSMSSDRRSWLRRQQGNALDSTMVKAVIGVPVEATHTSEAQVQAVPQSVSVSEC